MAAYGSIPRKNVATELYLEKDEELRDINGCSVIECMPGSDKTVYMINGIGVFLTIRRGRLGLSETACLFAVRARKWIC